MEHSFITYKDTVFSIIGAAMQVHSELRWGLLEAVYAEALSLELSDRGISNMTEKLIHCYYKHHQLKKEYKMDLVVDNDIIAELKSVAEIVPAHRAQLFNYLRLTKKPIGLLINFGTPKLQGERYGYDSIANDCVLLDKDMNIVPRTVDWSHDT